MVRRNSKVDNFANSLFLLLLIIIRSDLLAGIRRSVCMLKSHRSLCVSFSRTGAGFCIYHLLVWSNFNFLHISQYRPSHVSPYTPVLIYCIRLLCDWSFRLCHCIAYIYCFVASLFSIWYDWYLWRWPVLLLGEIPFLSERFPFLSQVQVFWCEMLFIRCLKRP